MTDTLILVPSALEMQHLLPSDARPYPAEPFAVWHQPQQHCAWAIGGIGPAAAAATAALLMARLKPQRVLLCGLGGAYAQHPFFEKKQLDPAQPLLVQASSERFADLGYREAEALVDVDAMGLDMLTLKNQQQGCRFDLALWNDRLPKGPFTTVSSITNSRERASMLFRQYGALCENMEGAGVALSCRLVDVPFFQVRAISNMVGPRDPKSWLIEGPLAALKQWLLVETAL